MADNPKVLAVESDPDVLALYHSYLGKRGYEVLSARGGVEGMNLLKANPDTKLVILALELRNGMSGEEWLVWFEQNRPSQAKLVVASGKNDILTCTKGNNGLSALSKPFHMAELEELIDVLTAPNWKQQVSEDKRLH